ncbi:MAG TPA: DUF3857 and transglutaminase domain-containing protein, partial [Steroidobacteraceae bacterium]|nr:DUF3857 and transglutaminase domain-containing protein [Steroidobacteraceae bacterium]
MRAQVNTPMPDHDEKADAALLYAETTLTVAPNGTIKKLGRLVFKILRPDGEKYGTVGIPFDAQSKITSLHAWSIPAAGKDYEVKEKDAVESAVVGVENSVLVSDVRTKLMRIPAATPGSIVGYEYEQEQRPYMMIDEWDFQSTVPVREAHFALRLPRGWNYNATWINHAEVSPTASEGAKDGSKLFQWTMNDVNPVRHEDLMPPWQGIAARMVIALQPPNGQDSGMQSWRDIGVWYASLTRGRRDASPEIKKQVADLTATAISPLQKMQALAKFVQNDVRYVAIELGIGGFQPHPAVDVFKNRFGDCKDKATLLSTMLKEVGIESYYVVINTERGSMDAMTPPNLGFNHVILAIALPSNIEDATLLARATQPQLANILFFDPTDEFTPFGRLRGELQANFGL